MTVRSEHQPIDDNPLPSRRERSAAARNAVKVPVQRRNSVVINPRQYAVRRRG